MAFIKTETQQIHDDRFNTFEEAKAILIDPAQPIDKRLKAVNYCIHHQEFHSLLKILGEAFHDDRDDDHPIIDHIFTQLPLKPTREIDFEVLFKLLESDNAYLRNAAISFFQGYQAEIKPHLEALFNTADRDVRIFVVNILGDLRLEDSVGMLHAFIAKEVADQKDLNVIMTAVDYLGEIGTEEDIPLLQAVKTEFNSDPYVTFGVDMAIKRIKGEL